LGLVLGAARLELGQVGLGGRYGLALGHQEVAAEARLDLDLVAQVAEVRDLLQEDQLHGRLPQALWLSVYGISARKRERLTAVASWRWYCDLVPVMRLGTILPVSVRYWRSVLR